MTEIELPALRGDRIVGYLAALGVLRLLAENLGDDGAELWWPHGGTRAAVVSTSLVASVEGLAARLYDVLSTSAAAGEIVPGSASVPRRPVDNADPMNSLSFSDGVGLAEGVAADAVSAAWLVSMVGLGSVAQGGKLKRSRWWAVGPGPVTIAGTLTKSVEAVHSSDELISALVGWRRHNWVGGYLDVFADVGKERIAGSRSKDEVKSAVVGATWLALMATPFFAERTVSESRTETVGWSVRERQAVFTYPVWALPRTVAAVRCTLDHPALTGSIDWGTSSVARRELSALGVVEMWQARRLRSGNNNAAVTHPTLLWSAE